MRTLALFVCALSVAACKQSQEATPIPAGTTTPSAAAAPTASATPSLTKGDRAPDFKLEGSDGKTHALADDVGKRAVVLAWFPKAFTGG